MRIWKISILAILIFWIFPKIMLADSAPLDLIFGKLKTDPAVRAIMKDGNVYINLPFLNNYLNIVTARDIGKNDVYLKFGKVNIKLYANDPAYYLNGKSTPLDLPPFEEDGQFWLPLQFVLKLGLAVKHNDDSELVLDWDRNYLLSVESVKYHNRPAIMLLGSGELDDPKISNTPEGFSLELSNTAIHFALDEQIKNPAVSRAVFEQTGDNLRVNFTLKQTFGYQLIRDSKYRERFWIVFNYAVEAVNIIQEDGTPRITVKTTSPAEYQVLINNRQRLAIDFNAAIYTGNPDAGSEEMEGTDESGKSASVRLWQLDPETVRLEAYFAGPGDYDIVPSPDDPTLLEIKKIAILHSVNITKTAGGAELTVRGDSALTYLIPKNKNQNVLWLEFQSAQFEPDLTAPDIQDTPLTGLRLAQISPTTARIEIGLAGLTEYLLSASPDQRQLTVSFKRSPIFGKKIVIDPGHGGEDTGACGRQGTFEKDNNLGIALRLKDLLEHSGVDVALTRTDDTFIGLYERAFFANALGADLFISIHTNNQPDLNVHGIEVYSYPGRREARILAKNVLERITRSTGFNSLGALEENFAVIRETQMPAILVEVGYLSNYQEEQLMRTSEFKDDAAYGIYKGIMSYYDAFASPF